MSVSIEEEPITKTKSSINWKVRTRGLVFIYGLVGRRKYVEENNLIINLFVFLESVRCVHIDTQSHSLTQHFQRLPQRQTLTHTHTHTHTETHTHTNTHTQHINTGTDRHTHTYPHTPPHTHTRTHTHTHTHTHIYTHTNIHTQRKKFLSFW